MNQQQMIVKLKKYIVNNHGNESGYAEHKGFSRAHINAITVGTKPPTKDILNDIGLVKVVTKTEKYLPCAKNLND